MKRFYCFLVAAILFCACSEDWKNGKRLGEKPVLFPDYAQTTIPYNIAPLNFTVRADGCRVSVLLEAGVVKFKVEAPRRESQDSGKEMEEAFAGGKR